MGFSNVRFHPYRAELPEMFHHVGHRRIRRRALSAIGLKRILPDLFGMRDVAVMDLHAALESEAQIQASLMTHADFREAYDAFVARRQPKFL